ncbi:hypothetical protein [Ramlibacter algicola]|uniref:DUF4148 domain-containing protein n=1 Tax=Ramlibacter algicola TaxID=2795217 RepID=A0A934Q0X8_9BURK|nr:hypothetical protein [Ramlibacter algicola]MBK0392821.1 hypothetical protein [Ramlibacter algicola]
MQVRFFSIAAALLASSASFTGSIRAADRATVHQEAVIAAHSMVGYGEFGPALAQPQRVSASERAEARAARREAGSQAARFVRYGDVEIAAPARPATPSMVTVSERRTETRRANLAGELGGTGEMGRF